MVDWLFQISILMLSLIVLAIMAAASILGRTLNRRDALAEAAGGTQRNETQEGYVVGAVLTLLALLVSFTFAMAIDRFETRRALVLEDAEAIETLYLRAQLLDEPHRSRFSNLLVRYTENRIPLAEVHGGEGERLLAVNDRLITDLWTATVPAFNTIRGIDFSSSFVDSVNRVIEMDAARKAARTAKIPPAIFAILLLYAFVTAFMLGYVITGRRTRIAGGIVLILFSVWLLLLADINRPVTGFIRESQAPMERLRATMQANPPEVFDRLRAPTTTDRP